MCKDIGKLPDRSFLRALLTSKNVFLVFGGRSWHAPARQQRNGQNSMQPGDMISREVTIQTKVPKQKEPVTNDFSSANVYIESIVAYLPGFRQQTHFPSRVMKSTGMLTPSCGQLGQNIASLYGRFG